MPSVDDGRSQAAYTMLGTVFTFVFVFAALLAWYQSNPGPINRAILAVNRAELAPIALISTDARQLRDRLQELDPQRLSFRHVMALTYASGRHLRWPVSVLLIGLGIWVLIDPRFGLSNRYRTVYTLYALLAHNVDAFPCLAPVVQRRRSLLDEPLDSGPWMTARKPIQFVAAHGLLLDAKGTSVPRDWLLNKHGLANERSPLFRDANAVKGLRLDGDRTAKLFADQLGPAFRDWSALPDYQRGLAAAFMAYGHGKRDVAQRLLDHLSLSFREADPQAGQAMQIDINDADAILTQYAGSDELQHFTRAHEAYIHPLFHALLMFAREKGVLACQEFIWLRPTDRTLWYALNQVGGRTAWVEAAGVWAHYQAEETMKQSIVVPQVDLAVVALTNALCDSGWLPREDGT